MRRTYNRYIPRDTDYIPVGRENPTPRAAGPAGRERDGSRARAAAPPPGLSALLGGREPLSALLSPDKGGKGLSSLLKALKLGDWDSGDLLLLLIILFLLAEGDDLELVIALGLALMMGLGEEKE